MIDFHWDLHVPLASRIIAGSGMIFFIATALLLATRKPKNRVFCMVWGLVGVLMTAPTTFDCIPEFIDLRGETLAFSQGPFPSPRSVKIAEIAQIEESSGYRGNVTFAVTKKGDLHLLTMPRPRQAEELAKLLAALRSRGIPVSTLPN